VNGLTPWKGTGSVACTSASSNRFREIHFGGCLPSASTALLPAALGPSKFIVAGTSSLRTTVASTTSCTGS
jgi:hypothetical protein